MLGTLGLGLILVMFRNELANHLFLTDIVSIQKTIQLEDPELRAAIDEYLENNPDATLHELTLKCLKLTRTHLRFRRKAKSIDPNQLRLIRDTHCVGYAAFFNSVLNYGLKKSHLVMDFSSFHARAKVYSLGIELTSGSGFWKDHDYVELGSRDGSENYRIDPSLFEFARIGPMKRTYAK